MKLKPDQQIQQLLESLYQKVRENQGQGLTVVLETLVNLLMRYERDRFLARHPEHQANGFYRRRLHLTLGTLHLEVPRVRIGKTFRPSLLPPHWQRVDRDYEELLLALLCNGYSRAQIARTLRRLGLPYSDADLGDLLETIARTCHDFQTRTLQPDWLAILIDAYHTQLRADDGRVRPVAIYTAIGIAPDGTRHVLGFWVGQGRESAAFWAQVLEDLFRRGVRRVLLFVSDQFPGLDRVIARLFPLALHQFCLVHLRRNLHRALPKHLRSQATRLWRAVRDAADPAAAHTPFDALVDLVRPHHPEMAQHLSRHRDHFLAFLHLPEPVRRYVYSTNAVESLHAGLEWIRLRLGGYFPSRTALDANLFVQFVHLQDTWSRRPIPWLRTHAYEIQQLFAIRFEMKNLTQEG